MKTGEKAGNLSSCERESKVKAERTALKKKNEEFAAPSPCFSLLFLCPSFMKRDAQGISFAVRLSNMDGRGNGVCLQSTRRRLMREPGKGSKNYYENQARGGVG